MPNAVVAPDDIRPTLLKLLLLPLPSAATVAAKSVHSNRQHETRHTGGRRDTARTAAAAAAT